MIADLVVNMDGEELDQGVLPTLNPVVVTASTDADRMFQAARASIAMLMLELRAAANDADTVDADTVEGRRATLGSDADVRAARDWLQGVLDQHLVEAQRELAMQLHTARIEAAGVVATAQAEAALIVETARAQMLQTLLGGGELGSIPPEGGGNREMPVLDLTVPPANGHQPAPRNEAPPLTNGHRPSGLDSAAVHSDGSGARINGAAVASPQETPFDAELSPVDSTEIRRAIAELPTTVTETVGAQETTEAGMVLPAVAEIRKRSPLAKFFYVDVLLPLTAVVILIVLLLALVG